MIIKIISSINYYLNLTAKTELLWLVFPLLLATIVMLIYFEKYKEERPGWNTHVANSLVLLFISIMLIKHIYEIGGNGSLNYITFPEKLFVAVALLGIGMLILLLNFEHFLPEKIARYVSSPLIINLVAYMATLFVYSTIKTNWQVLVALVIYFLLLALSLNIVRIPIKVFFRYIHKLKEKEKAEEIRADKKGIKEKKQAIKKEEKQVRKAKKIVKKEEEKITKQNLKTLDKQKKEAIKLKKLVKK